MERSLAPLSKPTVSVEGAGAGAPASSPPGLAADLGEARAGFRAVRSKQVSRRRLLPRERATASAHLSKEEPGVTSWVAPLRLCAGFGRVQAPRGRLRRSGQRSPARIASQGLPLAQRLAMKSRPWLRVAREYSGNCRSPRYVLSRNSILPEAKTARDKPPVFPSPNKSLPAKRGLRNADGAQALCQISDRVRQAP